MTRDAFEAWFSDNGVNPKAVERNGESYKLATVAAGWFVWQAATEQSKRQPLTVAQIKEVWDAQLFHITDLAMAIHFADDIQTALGITATP